MKIRNGFVSNSSSTSFCIYGVRANITIDMEAVDMEDKIEKSGLEIHNYGDYTYIGKSWSEIGDDETGKQFKENIEALLKQFGITEKCSTIEIMVNKGEKHE